MQIYCRRVRPNEGYSAITANGTHHRPRFGAILWRLNGLYVLLPLMVPVGLVVYSALAHKTIASL